MKKQKNNKPLERISNGRISLLKWENSNNGKTFESFSLNKTVMQRNKTDATKFTGRFLSLNGLTKSDLLTIKQLVTEMTDKDLDTEESD